MPDAVILLKTLMDAYKFGSEVASLIDRIEKGDSVTEEEIKAAVNNRENAINRALETD